MVAVIVYLFGMSVPAISDKVILAANVIFWASLAMTVYSGAEYVWKNRDVFSM